MPGLAVLELADRIRRAAFVERTAIRNLCGWFLVAPAYEVKHALGHHAWTHAEHADWFRGRLSRLRGGHPEASIDPALLRLMDLIRDSPDSWCFLRATYVVLLPALLSYYEEMLANCDPSANAADIRILNRVIPELREQVEWGAERLGADPDPQSSSSWSREVERVLISMGGIACTGAHDAVDLSVDLPGATRFLLPDEIRFDERIKDLPLMSLDERQALDYDDELREQFFVFFNEMYAAAMLATVVFEAIDARMEWRLVHGLCRHFWDEVRHSEFGAVRLAELGLEPDRCNQELFKRGLAMPLLHRVCYLTMVLEPYYMPRKKPRFKQYEEAGDERSQLFADHDWSDEINHVRFGKDALESLLADDARDVEALKEEVNKLLARRGEGTATLSPF